MDRYVYVHLCRHPRRAWSRVGSFLRGYCMRRRAAGRSAASSLAWYEDHRVPFLTASVLLTPKLVSIWTPRNKIRGPVCISSRHMHADLQKCLHPFLSRILLILFLCQGLSMCPEISSSIHSSARLYLFQHVWALSALAYRREVLGT